MRRVISVVLLESIKKFTRKEERKSRCSPGCSRTRTNIYLIMYSVLGTRHNKAENRDTRPPPRGCWYSGERQTVNHKHGKGVNDRGHCGDGAAGFQGARGFRTHSHPCQPFTAPASLRFSPTTALQSAGHLPCNPTQDPTPPGLWYQEEHVFTHHSPWLWEPRIRQPPGDRIWLLLGAQQNFLVVFLSPWAEKVPGGTQEVPGGSIAFPLAAAPQRVEKVVWGVESIIFSLGTALVFIYLFIYF